MEAASVKIHFKILLFIVCLNLATGMTIALALPGTEYVMAGDPSNPASNASYYEEHFNATDIAGRWDTTPFSGIPIVGDIFSGFSFLFQNLQFLIDGFPMFLTWISDTYLIDASARSAFSIISNILRAIYTILMSIFVIEFISGRYMTN